MKEILYRDIHNDERECVQIMKKKFLALLVAMVMLLSMSVTAIAAERDGTSGEDNATINGKTYFYDQFDNSAYRTVYKQIVDSATTFHNSSVNANYQDGGYYTAFTLSIANKDWEVIGKNGLDQIMNAVLSDHPEFFWMSTNYTSSQKSSGELRYTELVVECYDLYANGSTRSVYANNYKMVVQDYVAMADAATQDYEKVYLIHNAIINRVYYADDITSPSKDTIYAYTADGVFNSKYQSAVTYGYAKAFKAIMDALDIPCLYIEGQNSDLLDNDMDTQKALEEKTYINNCAWNAVFLGGEWYLINVGLDDPVTKTGKDALSYKYFNITDKAASNLTAIPDRLPGIPECTGSTFGLSKVQEELESGGIWEKSSYNFFDKILDKYGLSVVLISIGLILLLSVALIKRIHKRHIKKREEKMKNTKTKVLDHAELDSHLR